MVDEVGKIADHIASLTIVLQFTWGTVVVVVAWVHRHPIRRQGKRLLGLDDKDDK